MDELSAQAATPAEGTPMPRPTVVLALVPADVRVTVTVPAWLAVNER
jgi:hypothetical protein